jgi:hypothetical protein
MKGKRAGRKYPPFEIRFKAAYTVNKKTGCWEWNNPSPCSGYGGIDYEGKTIGAHRAAWLHFKGPIPPGKCALHKCDNRCCVNYKKHLYVGTRKDNRQDFMKRHPRAKQLVEIGIKAGTKGLRKFWRDMTPLQRSRFCRRRLRTQLAKNGGHGPRWKGAMQ